MRIERLGDGAVVLYDLQVKPCAAALYFESLTGCIEAVSSYESVGLYFAPGTADLDAIERHLETFSAAQSGLPKEHRIPVCYALGEDLTECCAALEIRIDEFIELHTSVPYECHAIGFTPGFPYLGYLPDEIAGLPRKTSPRVRVPAGSVGITGRQTGIYPCESPGGWNIIGRTPLGIVDVEEGYFPLQAGDMVLFHPIDEEEFGRLKGIRL